MITSLGAQTLESMSQAVWYNKWTLNKFEKYLRGDILEVGCGIGNFTSSLTKYGRVWAIDVNKNYIRQLKKISEKGEKIGMGDIENGKYFFKDKKFDCVVCINVLEHIKDDQKALENIFKLLKKDGHLILLVPSFDFLYGGIDKAIGHYRRYSINSLQNFLTKAGFGIIYKRILNMMGAIGWFISARLFSDTKVDENRIKIFNAIAPIVLPIEDMIEPPFGTSMLIVAKK